MHMRDFVTTRSTKLGKLCTTYPITNASLFVLSVLYQRVEWVLLRTQEIITKFIMGLISILACRQFGLYY